MEKLIGSLFVLMFASLIGVMLWSGGYFAARAVVLLTLAGLVGACWLISKVTK